MARRRTTTTKRRTRRKTKLNVMNSAQALVLASIYTRGVFNVNIPTFLGLRKDFSGGMTAGNNSNEITLGEIFNAAMGGSGGQSASYAQAHGGITGTLVKNAKENGREMIVATVAVPIAFKLAKKALSRAGVSRGINKTLDFMDLKEVRV